ncbi:hypothetical protein ACLMJK_008893 [Lecanora helva]
MNTFFTLFFTFPVIAVGDIGAGVLCCDLALQKSAYISTNISRSDYKCGQSYREGIPPAPQLSVLTPWCQANCPGYALTSPSDTGAWANPLAQYILPAVLFSMTIPRRLMLEPSTWLFDFSLHELHGLIKAVFSLCIAGVIVTLDTALWIFTIMIAPGPFIFSGFVEAVLDYRIIRNLLDCHIPGGDDHAQCLDREERTELLTVVLAGNLGKEEPEVNPQEELREALDIIKRPDEVEVRLRAMLACQYTFGSAVGGPVLFYIGAFAYTIASLHNAKGDQDTARALAFGIWWMNIVHVAVISGLLLASNNPNTAAGFVSKHKTRLSLEERLGFANKRSEMEDRIQARVEAYSRLSLTYRARYEPVWMWNRGKSKAQWLHSTAAWEKPWFREKVHLTISTWIFLTLIAYTLVLLPCALALWIEINTPPTGLGCRSMTMVLWACVQSIFVVLCAWSHFKGTRTEKFWSDHAWLDHVRRPQTGILVAIVFLLPAWIVAVFTTFAGTLMQITGIFENCICLSTGYWSFPPGSTVSLATDTIHNRHASRYWNRAGYAALIFLACVTYLGWWSQRYLREKFIERVKHLVDGETNPIDGLAVGSSISPSTINGADEVKVSDD